MLGIHLRGLWLICLLAMACLSSPAWSAEYFVSVDGNDSHAGTSPAQPLATIQKGVDLLSPGDTLTIAPGEYHESVKRDDLGGEQADTTIRAMIPGTVTLRGDRPIAGFEPVKGYRFVHATRFDGQPQGVLETSTPLNLRPGVSLVELEARPGHWLHDQETGTLYISTTDLQPPATHQYTVSTSTGHGLMLTRPTRVVIEGLVATGFQSKAVLPDFPNYYTYWGFMLIGPRQCVIRQCTAYLNGGGINANSGKYDGRDNRIEHCTAFANDTNNSSEVGNIISSSTNNDVIEHCYFYGSRGNGMRFYGAGIRGPAIARHNIAWGNGRTDYFLKGGKVAEFGLVENSVSLGQLHSANVKNSIIGTTNQYNREPAKDNYYMREAGATSDQQFADPANLDFRLQEGSKFIGSGPDGGDRGPFPYKANIFFVKSDGNDKASGLSVKRAWRTLDRALAALRPGDTLYIVPGRYAITKPIGLKGDADHPIAIRGRGIDPVIIQGKVDITSSSHLNIERLTLADPLVIRDSDNLLLRNNTFFSKEVSLLTVGVKGLRLSHNQFMRFGQAGLDASTTTGLHLEGNLFDNTAAPAVAVDDLQGIIYADYNAYAQADGAWRVGKTVRSLKDIQPAHERYASVRRPRFSVSESGEAPQLANAGEFRSGGPRGETLGLHHEYRPRPIRLVGPVVHSSTSTTANIEWWTSIPTKVELAWGPTPACENTLVMGSESFGSYSLTGLTPGQTYYLTLRSLDAAQDQDKQTALPVKLADQPLAFTTPTQAHEPQVYYVSPQGDDANTGLGLSQAWRTVAHAGSQVLAGDTVLIAGGVYSELVYIRGSGDEGRPVTFKAMPGQQVIFDGQDRLMSIAFQVGSKHFIRLDAFYFRMFGLKGWETILNFQHSSQIEITRCFLNNRGRGYPAHFMCFINCQDITLRNNVFANGMYGMNVREGVRNLRMEHCVFVRNFITVMNVASPREADTVVVKGNIFTDSLPGKSLTSNVHLFEVGGFEQYVFEDNLFFLRKPDDERKPFLFYGGGPGRLSVAGYEKQSGHGGNIFGDPKFAVVPNPHPKDGKGNPIPYIMDWVFSVKDLDFPSLFTTDPVLIERGIGLQPQAFADFHFNAKSASQDQAR